MQGKFTVADNSFSGCDTGIRVDDPSGIHLHVERNKFSKVRTGNQICPPPHYAIRGELGLKVETPDEAILQLLLLFRDSNPNDPASAEVAVRKSSIQEWLGATADLTTIAVALLGWLSDGTIDRFIQSLSSS